MYWRERDPRTGPKCQFKTSSRFEKVFLEPWSKFNNDIYISPICVTHARAMEGWYCSCRKEEDDNGTSRNMTEVEELAHIIWYFEVI